MTVPRRASSGLNVRLRAKAMLACGDALAVLAAAAITFTAEVSPGVASTHRSLLVIFAGAPGAWVFALSRQRLYTARRIGRRIEEFRRIVRASGMAVALLAVTSFVTNTPLSRSWLLTMPVVSVLILSAEREVARQTFMRLRRAGHLRRPVVIVGANEEAIDLARVTARDPISGYEVVGFVTDMPLEVIDERIRSQVLGNVRDVPSIVTASGAVGVVIASTAVTTSVSNRLARTLTEVGVHVEITSTLKDISSDRLTVSQVGPCTTLYVEAVRRGGWRSGAKRAFDIMVSLAIGLLLLPVLTVVALVVRLTSRGPVLFRQVRVGLDGTPFEVLKFRTMVPDAERRLEELLDLNEAGGPLFKMTHDPRVTGAGRILRKTSLDELPQLWNVVRGEMSLVGPRPAIPAETLLWDTHVRERLRVKPGITGMWQVNGRSSASFDDYVRLDLCYVDNWSLVTDLAILAKTVPAVLLRRGAV